MTSSIPAKQGRSLDDLFALFRDRGNALYGAEAVSQLQHALQCATLAEAAGSSASLISACLLHDVGHLIHALGDDAAARGLDDRHEYRAIPFLKSLLPDAVLEPIRLHVDAKRYLCATDPGYWSILSPASQCSLQIQGGIFSPDEAEAFMGQPFAHNAVQLRRWDEEAKVVGRPTPDLEHFRCYLVACQRDGELL